MEKRIEAQREEIIKNYINAGRLIITGKKGLSGYRMAAEDFFEMNGELGDLRLGIRYATPEELAKVLAEAETKEADRLENSEEPTVKVTAAPRLFHRGAYRRHRVVAPEDEDQIPAFWFEAARRAVNRTSPTN